MKRFAHYDLHKVEIVGLDEKENNYSYVKVFDATGLVFFKGILYHIGWEDYWKIQVTILKWRLVNSDRIRKDSIPSRFLIDLGQDNDQSWKSHVTFGVEEVGVFSDKPRYNFVINKTC